jgi:uncharacterized protein
MVAPFDPDKDRRNRAKHHIGLSRFDDMTDRLTVRSPHVAEVRFVVFGRIDGIVHAAVVTPRDQDLRVISLRRASRRERKDYARVYPIPSSR